jgi:hypothetical protein
MKTRIGQKRHVRSAAFFALGLAVVLAGCQAEPPDHRFGEMSRMNFHAMLANPADAERARAETSRPAMRRDAVLRLYASGKRTASERGGAETVKVAPVNGTGR